MLYIGGKITKKIRMEKAELKIDYMVYEESYPEGYEDLCRAALKITENAYCAYSGFAVGAAVLMDTVYVPSVRLYFMPPRLTRGPGSRRSPLRLVIMGWKWTSMSLLAGRVGRSWPKSFIGTGLIST